jgi:hypothetical protein
MKVEQRLNATGYLNIIANQVHPFMAVVYPSATQFLSAGLCHKASIVHGTIPGHVFEFSLLQWPAQSQDLNPVEHLWDEMERAI